MRKVVCISTSSVHYLQGRWLVQGDYLLNHQLSYGNPLEGRSLKEYKLLIPLRPSTYRYIYLFVPTRILYLYIIHQTLNPVT
jgi:hypothetical protein